MPVTIGYVNDLPNLCAGARKAGQTIAGFENVIPAYKYRNCMGCGFKFKIVFETDLMPDHAQLCEGSRGIGKRGKKRPEYLNCVVCYRGFKAEGDKVPDHAQVPDFSFILKYPNTCDIARHRMNKGDKAIYIGKKLSCMAHRG